jgi:phage protein D
MSVDTQPIPIFRSQDFYIPAFEVTVGNSRLDRSVIRDIVRVSYGDSLTDVDSFDITINNWDARTRTFKYSDQRLFDPGKRVELWMGYFARGDLRLMLTGEITSLRPSFPSGGQPTLVISGLNLLHRLRRKQESHRYEKKTDTQIAREIAGRLGVTIRAGTPAGGTEEQYEYLLQDNQYDIVFLQERARRIGYDLFVEEQAGDGSSTSRIYFGPSAQVPRVTYELEYGRSLNEFQPNLTTANQVGSVTVRSWDNRKKKPIVGTAKRKELETTGLGGGGEQQIEQSFADREEVITDVPVNSDAEAKRLAKETLDRIAKDIITGSGSVVGLPDIRAGRVLQLKGLGSRFNGRYFITRTTHGIADDGYSTQFECRREDLKQGQS